MTMQCDICNANLKKMCLNAQQMNIKSSELGEVAKNVLGKYMHSIGLLPFQSCWEGDGEKSGRYFLHQTKSRFITH
jgi:hypothetical protein